MSSPALSTRLRFPEDRLSFVFQGPGQPILTPPRTGIKVYLDEAGTQPAPIQTLAGVSIPFATIYTGDDALVPEFLGPEGFVNRLHARVVGGLSTTYPLMAQYSEQLANLPTLLYGDGPPTSAVGAVGSFYIDRGITPDLNVPDEPMIYGPRTVSGWPAGVPIRGDQGAPGSNFVWTQSTPAATWVMDHPLPYKPSVTIIDSAGEVIYGDVTYPPSMPHRVIAAFGAPEAGIGVMT